MRDDLIPTSVAMKRLGVDRSTISRWVQLKKLAVAMRAPGTNGAMWFDPAEIDRLATTLETQRPASSTA